MRYLALAAIASVLSGCAQQLATIQAAGAAAIEAKRQINDMKARAIMAATCDISLGAYFRELSDVERKYAALVCGGQFPRDDGPEVPAP